MTDAELEDLEGRIANGYAALDRDVLLALVAEVRRARHPGLQERVRARLAEAVDRGDAESATRWGALEVVLR